MALRTSLVVHYKGSDVSDAVGGHPLTNNSATFAAGKIDTAFTLSAAGSQYLTAASHADFQTGNIDFTIACWCNLASKAATMMLAGKWNGSGGYDYVLYYDQSADRFAFALNSNGSSQFANTNANALGSPSTATWYYVAAGYDSVNDQIFINVNGGTRNTVANTLGMFVSTSPFTIGRNDDATTSYWDGQIDEVSLWKRALSQAETIQLTNGGQGLPLDAWDITVYHPSVPPGAPTGGPSPFRPLRRSPTMKVTPSADLSASPTVWAPPRLLTAGPAALRLRPSSYTVPPRPAPAAPVGPGRGKAAPYVCRVPDLKGPNATERLRRFTEEVTELLNSLVRQGIAQRQGNDVWVVRAGGFHEARAPGVADDVDAGVNPGVIWVNSATGDIYVNKTNARGAATWRLL